MKKVKFELKEVLVCPVCGEEVDICSRCGEPLMIEVGCDYDGYCDEENHEHICRDCFDKEGKKNE